MIRLQAPTFLLRLEAQMDKAAHLSAAQQNVPPSCAASPVFHGARAAYPRCVNAEYSA
jgi:hypothetical protein